MIQIQGIYKNLSSAAKGLYQKLLPSQRLKIPTQELEIPDFNDRIENYQNQPKIAAFISEAERKFDPYNSSYSISNTLTTHISLIAVVNHQGIRQGKGLYIACSIPLGVMLFEEEGYEMSGFDKDKSPMEFGKKWNLQCMSGEVQYLTNHVKENSLDFVVSRHFKRKNYLTEEDDILKVLEEEYKVLKVGGISVSSGLIVSDSPDRNDSAIEHNYLGEHLEDLFIRSPFGNNFVRYIVSIPGKSRFDIIDVLKKI